MASVPSVMRWISITCPSALEPPHVGLYRFGAGVSNVKMQTIVRAAFEARYFGRN